MEVMLAHSVASAVSVRPAFRGCPFASVIGKEWYVKDVPTYVCVEYIMVLPLAFACVLNMISRSGGIIREDRDLHPVVASVLVCAIRYVVHARTSVRA